MQAIETKGLVDHEGQLKLTHPLPVRDQSVRVLILLPDSDALPDEAWLRSVAQNPAFDFLRDEDEAIYSPADGVSIES